MSAGSEPPEGLRPSQRRILDGVMAREEARRQREEARLNREEPAAARERSPEAVARSAEVRATTAGAVEALIHEVEGLNEALRTRMVIANAVGLLMARDQLDREDAFDQLRQASRRSHRKLRDLATEIVEGHERHIRESTPP